MDKLNFNDCFEGINFGAYLNCTEGLTLWVSKVVCASQILVWSIKTEGKQTFSTCSKETVVIHRLQWNVTDILQLSCTHWESTCPAQVSLQCWFGVKNDGVKSDVRNQPLITDHPPSSMHVPHFDLPCCSWILLNQYWAGQSQCAASLHTWPQTRGFHMQLWPKKMSHIDCPLTGFDGDLEVSLHWWGCLKLAWQALHLRRSYHGLAVRMKNSGS